MRHVSLQIAGQTFPRSAVRRAPGMIALAKGSNRVGIVVRPLFLHHSAGRPALQRLPEPNPRVAGRKVIEPTEFPISMSIVEFWRLERERVEIGGAAALLTRGRLPRR